MKTLKVVWWKDYNNFGDILTPVLLERLVGIKSKWAEPWDSEFMGVGSYLDGMDQYKGIVWGTGRMFPGGETDLSKANVLAVRGQLTRDIVKTDCDVLGDPGLLCKLIAPKKVKKTHEFGMIPHWNDSEMKDIYKGDYFIIDVTQDVDIVIKQVASCKNILSSSLHGLVLADALGIRRRWSFAPKNPGEGFKFRDYQSIFGDTIVPGIWYKADQEVVDETVDKLLTALKTI